MLKSAHICLQSHCEVSGFVEHASLNYEYIRALLTIGPMSTTNSEIAFCLYASGRLAACVTFVASRYVKHTKTIKNGWNLNTEEILEPI